MITFPVFRLSAAKGNFGFASLPLHLDACQLNSLSLSLPLSLSFLSLACGPSHRQFSKTSFPYPETFQSTSSHLSLIDRILFCSEVYSAKYQPANQITSLPTNQPTPIASTKPLFFPCSTAPDQNNNTAVPWQRTTALNSYVSQASGVGLFYVSTGAGSDPRAVDRS